MSKRDTIIVAVLINIGLLAVLYLFGMNTSEDQGSNQSGNQYTLEDNPATPVPENGNKQEGSVVVVSAQSPTAASSSSSSFSQTSPSDEVDDALNSYHNQSRSSTSIAPTEMSLEENGNVQNLPADSQGRQDLQNRSDRQNSSDASEGNGTNEDGNANGNGNANANVNQKYVDVVIKRGDALEKIARAYGTTVEEIKKANDLTSERLDIGQELKVPANKIPANKSSANAGTKAKASPANPSASNTSNASNKNGANANANANKAVASADPVYYTIKSGDNPWKIARQFKVKYEDILRLNNLNEEKARNLKVGDQIRVK